MTEKEQILEYLAQANRNRLVFCHNQFQNMFFTDVGRTLSDFLSNENLHSSMVAYAAEDALNEILSRTQEDDIIGTYVAMYNIGILFEPELGFNLKSILDSASTNKTIIICSDGMIKSDRFYFLQEGDNDWIDLKELSYIELKQN